MTIEELNDQAVHVAMRGLYDTHVTDPATAHLRGEAIQAVGRFADALGVVGLIAEMEATPHSKRRRESPLWQRMEEEGPDAD